MKVLHVLLAVMMLLVSACSAPTPLPPTATPILPKPTATSAPTDTAIPPTATAESNPMIPDGTYSTTMTKEELVVAGFPDFLVCENAGILKLTFTGNRWELNQTPAEGCKPTSTHAIGSVKYPTSGKVRFFDEGDVTLMGPCSPDFLYRWKIDGDELTFLYSQDGTCPWRVTWMTKYPWIKEK